VFITDFWEERLRDTAIHELAGLIKVVQDLTITDENISVPLRLRIRLKNGAEHELTLDQMLGHPDKPLSHEQHLAKFRACWAAGASRLPESNRDQLVEMVDGLEVVPSAIEVLV
jgi:2-methylcitrate dehydratase PrpD